MSDEDPKSLLTLCDDTLIKVLSFMPLKSQVKHSRTSRSMANLVDESLLTVTTLKDKSWFLGIMMRGKLKTLSKLKNLRSVDSYYHFNGARDEAIAVLAEHCHCIQHVRKWDVRCIALFVRKLMEKGIPVRLKTMSLDRHIHSGPCDPSLKGPLKYLMQKTDVKLCITCHDWDMVTETGTWDRVAEMLETSSFIGYIPRELPLNLMTNVKKVTGLHLDDDDGDFLERVLQSLPHLKHIGINCHGDADLLLQILSQADQKFEGIEFLMLDYFSTDASTYHGDPHIFCSRFHLRCGVMDDNVLQQLLRVKGQRLKTLGMGIIDLNPKPTERVIHVLNLIRSNCTNLRSFRFSLNLYWNHGDASHVSVYYSDRRLILNNWDNLPMSHVLTLVPKVRTVLSY